MTRDTVEKVVVTQTPVSETQTRTVTSRGPVGDFFVSKVNQVIFAFVGIINLLLLLRILFLLAGANRVGIVNSILAITDVFVAPFRGIFPSPATGDAYFDTAAVVAIIMYIVLGVILGVIVNLFSTDTETL